jgi:OOP family OmpA-OmpF porin
MFQRRYLYSILPLILLLAAARAEQRPGGLSPQAGVSPGRVIVSGAVPDESTKAAVLAKLQAVYGPGKIVDQVTVGGVIAPPNWSAHVPRLINRDLATISKGQLVVEGTNVSLRGEVRNEAARQTIASGFAGALTPDYVIQNGLRVSNAGQSVLDQTLANRVVEFERSSALLTDSGKTILDEMTAAMGKVSMTKVEVIGHTDDRGKPERNADLSRERAESVKTYLVAKGISPTLIVASGMGADQPIVPNTTSEGRKRNRRIEFRVTQ